MPCSGVPEAPFQYAPLFEPPINSLMPGTGKRLHPLIITVDASGSFKEFIAIKIATISQSHFIVCHLIDQPVPGNPNIRPFASWKRAISPHYLSCLNRNSNLISHCRAIELVTVPLWMEWDWFPDAEVCSINSDLADGSIIKLQPVLKLYLFTGEVMELIVLVAFCFVTVFAGSLCAFKEPYPWHGSYCFKYAPVPLPKSLLISRNKKRMDTFCRIHLQEE